MRGCVKRATVEGWVESKSCILINQEHDPQKQVPPKVDECQPKSFMLK